MAIIVRLLHPNSDTDKQLAQDQVDAASAVLFAVKKAKSAVAAGAAATAALTRIQRDASKTTAAKAAAAVTATAATTAAAKAGATLANVIRATAAKLPKLLPSCAMLRLAGASPGDDLVLRAANEGTWGNALRVRIDEEDVASVGDRYSPLTSDKLFNLTVRDAVSGTIERFLCVTIEPGGPRALDKVLEDSSTLVRVATLPTTKPKATDTVIKDALLPTLQPIIDKGTAVRASPQQKQAGINAQKQLDAYAAPFKLSDEFRYIATSADNLGSDGSLLTSNDITGGPELQDKQRGLYALENADLFNLLCIPPENRSRSTNDSVYRKAMAYCASRRAMLIVDPPAISSANKDTAISKAKKKLLSLGAANEPAQNAAFYFPRVVQTDPLREGQLATFVPCGIIAGIMARTDATRGVWNAPAGLQAALIGIQDLQLNLSDAECQMLNPLGINCLRLLPTVGRVVWGSRTLRGSDQWADGYKYIPVRRLALYIEESLRRGTKWVVFESNDEPLWAQIRLNVGAFMDGLFRMGAFRGNSPKDAYFVKCDKESTSQNDIDHGLVNIVVGFAALKPAEFIWIRIQQSAGRNEV